MDLTNKQKETLQLLKEYIDKNGYAPTIRELCKIANVNSSCTIYKHLLHLKEKGYIDYVPNKSRTIKILKGVK